MFHRRATVAVVGARFPAFLLVLLAITGSLVASGCAGNKPTDYSSESGAIRPGADTAHRSASSFAVRAASIAEQQVGVPYRYGGANTGGFDCSGLVYFAYANAGKQVARTTGGLWGSLLPIQKSSLQAGDVLFFDIDGKMSHVGMYLGDGKFVHAPSTGKKVSIADLESSFYRRALIRGGRAK